MSRINNCILQESFQLYKLSSFTYISKIITDLFLCSLKTSGNLQLSNVSQVLQKETSFMIGLQIFFINRQNIGIHACSLTEDAFIQLTCTFFSMHSGGIKFQRILIQVYSKEHLSVTAFDKCSWQPIKTINCFYYSIYFEGNKLKKTTFLLWQIF